MTGHTIPVIDLRDYFSSSEDKRTAFITGIGTALREVGFFALTGHGIEQSLIDRAYRLQGELFELSTDDLKRYENMEIKGQRGYTSFGREHAKDHNAPDLKEFWHVGQELDAGRLQARMYPENIWPSELPEFKPAVMALFEKLEQCALSLLEACALYIGEPRELIRDMAVEGNSILRLIHYPPVPEGRDPASIRAAAHEDINLITLLVDATAPGLEILGRNGEWIPVITPENCIIVDAGDMLQNLTNGFYKSTTHRVTNPGNNRDRRYSMPFFVHARSEASLNPLASCIERTGGEAHYPRISAGEYLHKRLVEIGLA